MRNKLFRVLVVSLISLFSFNLTANCVEKEYIRVYKGDVNHDGSITEEDASLVLQAATELTTLKNFQKEVADIDDDGYITANDSLFINQMYGGSRNKELILLNTTIDGYSDYVLSNSSLNNLGLYKLLDEEKQYIKVYKGDTNHDGSVTEEDANSVLQYLTESETYSDFQKEVADMDGENEVNSYDSSLILQTINNTKELIVLDTTMAGYSDYVLSNSSLNNQGLYKLLTSDELKELDFEAKLENSVNKFNEYDTESEFLLTLDKENNKIKIHYNNKDYYLLYSLNNDNPEFKITSEFVNGMSYAEYEAESYGIFLNVIGFSLVSYMHDISFEEPGAYYLFFLLENLFGDGFDLSNSKYLIVNDSSTTCSSGITCINKSEFGNYSYEYAKYIYENYNLNITDENNLFNLKNSKNITTDKVSNTYILTIFEDGDFSKITTSVENLNKTLENLMDEVEEELDLTNSNQTTESTNEYVDQTTENKQTGYLYGIATASVLGLGIYVYLKKYKGKNLFKKI